MKYEQWVIYLRKATRNNWYISTILGSALCVSVNMHVCVSCVCVHINTHTFCECIYSMYTYRTSIVEQERLAIRSHTNTDYREDDCEYIKGYTVHVTSPIHFCINII